MEALDSQQFTCTNKAYSLHPKTLWEYLEGLQEW